MAQESNFYRLYKLANKDRTQSFKASLLAIAIIACFALGSLFTLGLTRSFSWGLFSGDAICWFLGFSFLIIFTLTSTLKDFSLWTIVFSVSGFFPLLLTHQISKAILIEIVVLFVLFFFARIRMRAEYNALIHLNWWRIVHRGMFSFTLILVLILSTLVFVQSGQAAFQRSGIEAWNYLSSSTMKSLPGGIASSTSFSGTIDDILKNYLQKQSPQLGLEGEAGAAVTKPLLQGMKDNLSQMLHYPVKGSETIPTLLINWLKARWQTFSLPLKVSTGFLIFLVALSLLNFINLILSFLLIIGSSLLLQILMALKYIRITHKGVEKDILEL